MDGKTAGDNACVGSRCFFALLIIPNRRNTNSLKWDVAEGELPMWVADMDFPAAPEIRAAIEERADLSYLDELLAGLRKPVK